MPDTPQPLCAEELHDEKQIRHSNIKTTQHWLKREMEIAGQGLSVSPTDLTPEVIQLINAHPEINYPNALKMLHVAKLISQKEGITLHAALQNILKLAEPEEETAIDQQQPTPTPSRRTTIIPPAPGEGFEDPKIPRAAGIPASLGEIYIGRQPEVNKTPGGTRMDFRSKLLLVAALLSLCIVSVSNKKCQELAGDISESIQQILNRIE